ncbi:unnamed protein product [Rotaria magnacalcarata]|uniref:Timeless N-terminal domain-containing protein n=10 Tax=Rotaria magnacalcarata TaxID=392030 RepID=A0A816WEL5_9BILA|nr:unnamed protein product [Rotaria magnacalcarata]
MNYNNWDQCTDVRYRLSSRISNPSTLVDNCGTMIPLCIEKSFYQCKNNVGQEYCVEDCCNFSDPINLQNSLFKNMNINNSINSCDTKIIDVPCLKPMGSYRSLFASSKISDTQYEYINSIVMNVLRQLVNHISLDSLHELSCCLPQNVERILCYTDIESNRLVRILVTDALRCYSTNTGRLTDWYAFVDSITVKSKEEINADNVEPPLVKEKKLPESNSFKTARKLSKLPFVNRNSSIEYQSKTQPTETVVDNIRKKSTNQPQSLDRISNNSSNQSSSKNCIQSVDHKYKHRKVYNHHYTSAICDRSSSSSSHTFVPIKESIEQNITLKSTNTEQFKLPNHVNNEQIRLLNLMTNFHENAQYSHSIETLSTKRTLHDVKILSANNDQLLSLNDHQTACGALGYFDGKTYLKDDDCEDALRILLRCLKYENERKDARLHMLESKIIENDLVPILIYLNSKHDGKIINHTLKLLVNLTKPPLVCFDGKLPKDVTLTNVYLKIEVLLQKTKTSLANEKLFDFLVTKVHPVLDTKWLDRSDDDDFILHAVFTLVRNILSIKSERQISEESDINAHDLVLWAIHKSNMENLILFCGNKAQGDERIMTILEIIVLMLREQSAAELAATGEQQTKSKREKTNETLDLLYEREMAEKQQLHKLTGRRSAFGGATYVMCNAKGIGENQLICHRPLQSLNAMEFDREKRRFRRPKNRAPVKNDLDDSQNHHSALGIRLFLREFCLAFLDNCYNILMPHARDMIIKSTCLLSDETNFFWSIRFFTEFNRHAHTSIDRISETLQMNTFHLLHTKIDHYREMIKIDKTEARLWAKRLQIGFGAFKEYILCVKSMLTNSSEVVVRAATIIKDNIFYMQEYREQIYILLKDFDNTKMTSAYLHDLIECTHEFLKMLEEHTTKLKHVFVQRRRVARKPGTRNNKKKQKNVNEEKNEPPNEQLEEEWQSQIAERLSSLLQGLEEPTVNKSEVCPFDALSDVPIDDQSLTAVARIQHALRTNKLDEAIALFRASREVWPTEKTFGYEDIGAEEEFNLLREIFMTSKMDNLLPKHSDEDDENDEEKQHEAGHEEDDEELIETIEREEEFDFKRFIRRFAHSSILCSYIDVLRTYRTNTPFLNHCIIRMFYRVSVDCNFTGILFQMSLFRIFQKFHLDPMAKLQQFSELLQFGTWLLRKFFAAIQKNPCIYVELLFWKDRSLVEDMLDGYRQTTADRTNEGEKKTKAASWSIEHQIELRDIYRKIKEEQAENLGLEKVDVVDRIMLELTDKSKTRRQVIKELKIQGLIKSTRELRIKKAPKGRSKKKDFLNNSKLLGSDSDVPGVEDSEDDRDDHNDEEEDDDDDDDDDKHHSIENKSVSSEHKANKLFSSESDQDKSNDSNSEPNDIVSTATTKISQQTKQVEDDDDESLPILTKQTRKYESLSMFNDDDDDDDISTTRPIKKARRQLASSSEDDE